MGMIGSACCYLFDETPASSHVYLECFEIYDDKLEDLLGAKQAGAASKAPVLRERRCGDQFEKVAMHVTRRHVKSVNRNVGQTALNASSSRSHMVIHVVVCTTMARESVLNFVDWLALTSIDCDSDDLRSLMAQSGLKRELLLQERQDQDDEWSGKNCAWPSTTSSCKPTTAPPSCGWSSWPS